MERISYIHNDTNSIVNQLFFNIVKKKKKDWEKILCLWENYSVIIKEMEIIKLNLGAGQEKANIYHTELTSFKHMANTLWLIQHPLSFKTDNKESFCVCLRQASSDHKAQTPTQYGSRKKLVLFHSQAISLSELQKGHQKTWRWSGNYTCMGVLGHDLAGRR